VHLRSRYSFLAAVLVLTTNENTFCILVGCFGPCNGTLWELSISGVLLKLSPSRLLGWFPWAEGGQITCVRIWLGCLKEIWLD